MTEEQAKKLALANVARRGKDEVQQVIDEVTDFLREIGKQWLFAPIHDRQKRKRSRR